MPVLDRVICCAASSSPKSRAAGVSSRIGLLPILVVVLVDGELEVVVGLGVVVELVGVTELVVELVLEELSPLLLLEVEVVVLLLLEPLLDEELPMRAKNVWVILSFMVVLVMYDMQVGVT